MKNALGEGKIIEEVSDSIHLVYYPPNDQRSNGILITEGLSEFEMPVPERLEVKRRCELAFVFPSYWPDDFYEQENENYNWPTEWLKRIAVLPEKKNTWLGEGHSFPAEKLAPITEQEAFILVKPSVVKALKVEDDGPAVYAVVPITQKELNYKLKNGAPKFLKKFYTQSIEIIDLQRTPFKLKRFGFL